MSPKPIAVLKSELAMLREQDCANACSDDAYFMSGRRDAMRRAIAEKEREIEEAEVAG